MAEELEDMFPDARRDQQYEYALNPPPFENSQQNQIAQIKYMSDPLTVDTDKTAIILKRDQKFTHKKLPQILKVQVSKDFHDYANCQDQEKQEEKQSCISYIYSYLQGWIIDSVFNGFKPMNFRVFMQNLKKIQKKQQLYPYLVQQGKLYTQQINICVAVNAYRFIYRYQRHLQKIQINLSKGKIIFEHCSIQKTLQISIEDVFNNHAKYFKSQKNDELMLWHFLFKKAFIQSVSACSKNDEPGFIMIEILRLIFGNYCESKTIFFIPNSKETAKLFLQQFYTFAKQKIKQLSLEDRTYLTLHYKKHCVQLVAPETQLKPEQKQPAKINIQKLAQDQFNVGLHVIASEEQDLFLFHHFKQFLKNLSNKKQFSQYVINQTEQDDLAYQPNY